MSGAPGDWEKAGDFAFTNTESKQELFIASRLSSNDEMQFSLDPDFHVIVDGHVVAHGESLAEVLSKTDDVMAQYPCGMSLDELRSLVD